MKNYLLMKTHNKFSQMREEQGHTDPVNGTARHRISIGSIASRYSLATLICALMLTLGVGNVWGTDITFNPTSCTNMTASQTAQSQTISGVGFTITSGWKDTYHLRIYKSATATFTAPTGYTITKIVFTCTTENTSKYGPGCFGAGAPSGYSYASYTGTWTGSATSVGFTASDNQVRAESIVVTIAADVTYSVVWKSDGTIIDTGSTYSAVPSGSTVSTPSDPAVPSGCMGATFMGWTETEDYDSDSAPGDLFTGTSPAITRNTTFYAVFADED